jgi:hypothetical protein
MGLFASYTAIAQVGVGTENPEKGFEVEGSVRFRNLEEGDLKTFNREVLMNKEGELGYLEIESDRSYFVKMLSHEMENKVVLDKTDENKDLFLNIDLELLPNTISIFEIHYNVPFYFQTLNKNSYQEETLVSAVGVRLMKKQVNLDRDYVNVIDGNRSLSIISEYERAYPDFEFRGSFIEGMSIQEVVNDGSELKKISYKLMTYTKDNDGIVHFGSHADQHEGVGRILVKVYHKPYYGETHKK